MVKGLCNLKSKERWKAADVTRTNEESRRAVLAGFQNFNVFSS